MKMISFQLSIGKAAIPWGNTGMRLLALTPSLAAAGLFCSGSGFALWEHDIRRATLASHNSALRSLAPPGEEDMPVTCLCSGTRGAASVSPQKQSPRNPLPTPGHGTRG